MRIGSLFSGVGGLELGLELAGLGPVLWQVERDPFCREVLEKRWPDADRQITDVRGAGSKRSRKRRRVLAPVDLICGGFPCTDISVAGKGAGFAGARSGLWFEMARIVGELRPRHVLIENVAVLLRRGMDQVLFDLHRLGYDARWTTLHASDAGAPHKRARIFIAALRERDAEIGEQGKPAGWLASPDGKPARLPKHGMMAAGVAQEAPPLIGPAGSLAARLWPTPNVPNGGRVNPPGTSPTGRAPDGSKKQIDLQHAVTRWPTPNASDHKGANPPNRRPECDDDLPTRVARQSWPTPTACDAKASGAAGYPAGMRHSGTTLTDAAQRGLWAAPTASESSNRTTRAAPSHGQSHGHVLAGQVADDNVSTRRLSGDWVECLMGLPVGWTDLGCDTPVLSPGWPAPPGPQHEWEPPRTVVPVRGSHRLKRLKALGNAVVPQCAWIAAQMIGGEDP